MRLSDDEFPVFAARSSWGPVQLRRASSFSSSPRLKRASDVRTGNWKLETGIWNLESVGPFRSRPRSVQVISASEIIPPDTSYEAMELSDDRGYGACSDFPSRDAEDCGIYC